MISYVFTILSLVTLGVFFCITTATAEDRVTVSGSATVEQHADGTIAARKPTSSETKSLDALRDYLKEIDRRYPGPQIPTNPNLLIVSSVDDTGTISLENGQRILIEGVKCSTQGIIYLRKHLTGESDRIVYDSSSSNNQDTLRAYIWHASLSLMSDPELKKYKMGPAYSSLNETVLTSGWCIPDKSASNAYNDRYDALSKIAPNRY